MRGRAVMPVCDPVDDVQGSAVTEWEFSGTGSGSLEQSSSSYQGKPLFKLQDGLVDCQYKVLCLSRSQKCYHNYLTKLLLYVEMNRIEKCYHSCEVVSYQPYISILPALATGL